MLPTLTHLQRLDGYGVGWRSYTEQYLDSTGIFKDTVVSIMATIGKQENVRRSERITAMLSRLKAQGVRLGRPRVKDSKASRTTLWRRSRDAGRKSTAALLRLVAS